MKLKIKVKRINKNLPMPTIIDKGDWVDLRASKNVKIEGPQSGVLKYHMFEGKRVGHREVSFSNELIPLGIAMQLPRGFEAHMLSRSGTYKKYKIILANGEGIIDHSFKGDDDEWLYNAIAFADTTISEGDRICQFRIQLSQKATFLQKLAWLLCDGIEFVEVEHLNNHNRGGIGSTGVE